MTVREYIGARYIPLFMGNWDNTKAYEPLSIVNYQGDSYTSRQAVPIGIEITNEAYWFISGNYNAQVEAYRQEVEAVKAAIPFSDFDSQNTVKDYIDDKDDSIKEVLPFNDFDNVNTVKKYIDDNIELNKYSNSYVGLYGAKEKDATLDWQEIIDAVAANSNTIDFGSGTWYINEGIVFPEGLQAITGSGAIIETTSSVETLFDITNASTPGTGKRFFRINGIIFNCNANVETCIYSESPNAVNVSDCTIRDVTQYAIHCTVLGSFINNCYFNNGHENCRGRATAISTGTDSFIANCKAFYFNTFFEVGNTSVVTGNYIFAIFNHANTPAIGVKGNSSTTTCISITNNEFDCIQYICVDISNAVVKNNVFYWNNNDDSYTGSKALFVLNQMSDFRALTFSDNLLGFSNTLNGDYYTFLALNNNNGNTVGYVSEGNKTYPYLASGNIGNWSQIHFTIGFYDNSNVNLNRTGNIVYTRGITSTSVSMTGEPKQFVFYSHINETIYTNHATAKVVSLLDNNVNSLINDMYVGTSNAPLYIANLITALYKVVIVGGAAFNMDWAPYTSTPAEGTRYVATILS